MSESTDRPTEDLRRLTFDSLQIGLCPLIPVPLLDDWARDFLRRRLVARMIAEEQSSLELDAKDLQHLACGTPPPGRGCLAGCFFLAFVKPLLFVAAKVFRKVFRKIFFFLTVKDCVDRFSRTVHEAWLIRHALRLEALPSTGVEKIRAEIDAVLVQADPRPIERILTGVLRGSRRVLGKAGKDLGQTLRSMVAEDDPEDEDLHVDDPALENDDEDFGRLVDDMARELGAEEGYFEELAAQLSIRLSDGSERSETG